MSSGAASNGASLEALVEAEDLGLEVLHPGGLEITRELADLCHVGRESRVLDVSSGTGASAVFLAERFGCSVTGVDASDAMVSRARDRLGDSLLRVEFMQGDAHGLPFDDASFDAVISECTVCLLDKRTALREMVRVATPGGWVGIHDLCWKDGAPAHMKRTLAAIEDERPETLSGWADLLGEAGLTDVRTVDKSSVIPAWMREVRKRLGLGGRIRIFLAVIRRWGLGGLRRVLRSQRIFESRYMGYGLVVGRKP